MLGPAFPQLPLDYMGWLLKEGGPQEAWPSERTSASEATVQPWPVEMIAMTTDGTVLQLILENDGEMGRNDYWFIIRVAVTQLNGDLMR